MEKLYIRIMDAGGVIGGKASFVVDASGVALPNQMAVQVNTEADTMPTATVKFRIEGFWDSKQE